MSSADNDSWVSSTSSAEALECHLRNRNVALLKISVEVVFSCCTFLTVSPPLTKSSTYKLFLISSTTSGCCCRCLSRCCWITPQRRKGEGNNPNKALLNRSVIIGFLTATRREISVYTSCPRWCILLNLAYSAHKNVTLCYL